VSYFVVAAESPIYVYISEHSSFATERILYNALISVGETPYIERVYGGMYSLDQFAGRRSVIVAGLRESQSPQYAEEFSRIDIPIGKVEYTAYVLEGSGLYFDSWDDIEGLVPADALNIERNFNRLLDGRADVFVCSVYDDVKPRLPDGIVEAGVIQSEETYCMYQRSRTDTGETLRKGLETIKENGAFDRIKANKSINPDSKDSIFLLTSYSNDMIWQAQAEETFNNILSQHEDTISRYSYEMNFRRASYPRAQFDAVTAYARASFMDDFPDVIIIMDNDSIMYLQEYYQQMFYGVPIVFCGINDYSENITGEFSEFATGVSERLDPTGTVDFALSVNPNINRIYAIFDGTSSSAALKNYVLTVLENRYSRHIHEITSNKSNTVAGIIEELKDFDQNTLVILGPFFTDEDEGFIGERVVTQRLTEAVDIPIYTVLSGFLGYGVVGGRVSYSRRFMAEAVDMAMRILNGEKVSDIPVILEEESEQRFSTFMVDKKVADKFDMDGSLYESRALVLNDDLSIFEAYPIPSTIGIAVIFIAIITFILAMMLTRSNHARELALTDAKLEKESNNVKSEFLARMSHEIRTPLNAIININEIILREDISSKVRENVLVVKRSGKALLSIINDILDFSKLESGKMKLTTAEYDVSSLINDVISMIRAKVEKKHLDVTMDISDDFPAYLFGDETRLRQVLLNVLGNSAKYTHEGSIGLKAEFEFDSDEKTGGTAVFTLSDTGVGIKEEYLSKLFDAFSQVDTKANRNVEGTGLGLTITRTLLTLMNGEISVKSDYGKGSTFTLRIPQRIVTYHPFNNTAKEISTDTEEKEEHLFIAPDVSILAVDDIDINLMIVDELLSPYKVKVDTASSGIAAINAVLKKDYDFVFMDHMMPEMDGVEATQKIRNLDDEKFQHLPIIALTANAIVGMKEMYLANGFSDYISKPIDMQEFSRIMRTWIPVEKRQFCA
jgi:signal transduction histidine kinase/CheY-like chemotaxis protein